MGILLLGGAAPVGRQTRARRAFTLIELLVVISIVAVLAGMLLPAVSTVRDAARSAECRGRLRQVGMAVLDYAGDWDGLLIPGGRSDWPNLPVSDGTWTKFWNWRGILETDGRLGECSTVGGLGNFLKVLGCPTVQSSDSRIRMSNPISTMFNQSGLATYGLNQHLTCRAPTAWMGGNQPAMPEAGTPLSRMGRHAAVVLACDGRWNVNFYHVINYGTDVNNFPDRPHRGRANVVFLDGHVGDITLDKLTSYSTEIATAGSDGRIFWIGSP